MAKKRLYTLAKELGVTSKELLGKLQKEGLPIKSVLATLDADQEAVGRRLFDKAGSSSPPSEQKKTSRTSRTTRSSSKASKKAAGKSTKKKKSSGAAPSKKKARANDNPMDSEDTVTKVIKPGPSRAAVAALAGDEKPKATILEKSQQPKVKIIRAQEDPNALSPEELDKELELENRLLDIEESVQRRMGKVEPYGHRKRVDKMGDEGRLRLTPRRQTPGAGGKPGGPNRGFFSGPRRKGQGQKFGGRGGAVPVGRRGKYKKKKAMRLEAKAAAAEQERLRQSTIIRIGDTVVVADLASYLGVSAVELVKKLFGMGVMASVNQRIDFDTATLLAADYDFQVDREDVEDEDLLPSAPEVDPEELVVRPPVVTVMGHVDHGKTSLLDAIRQTDVVAGESGGITQHIGAYQVTIPGGQVITFLDTPGHEAFTAMRAHGAQVTDIAVLVVAADDGIKPQTVEAIFHSRAADVPMIVALNKMDKAGINVDRVYQELSQHDLLPEEWGGKTIVVKVSAKEKTGLEDLLEMIVLQSEMMELRAPVKGPGRGVVIESRMDKGRGPVATVLVQSGTISVGDAFVAGSVYGRVRAMEDHTGRRITSATPSVPVEMMGFSSLPAVADQVRVVENESRARQIAEKRSQRRKQASRAVGRKPSLEELLAQARDSDKKELHVVLRADVQGSVDAVAEALEKLTNEENISLKVIFRGTGAITESDVMFASASGAVIVGFHVRPPSNITKLAQQEGVEIRLYSVIYKAIEDMQDVLNGMLAPKQREVVLGQVQVRNVFTIPKIGRVAGCYVSEGKVSRNADARLIRDGVEVHVGRISSVRRFKDDVREVQSGYECGIRLENFQDIKVGDVIEVFVIEEVPRD